MVDNAPMIREELGSKRVVITGSTGFLGTALVERILRQVPGCELGLLIRPGRKSAEERARRELFKNDCFDTLRSELGDGFDEMIATRVRVLAGDVTQDGLGLDDEDLQYFSQADAVIHSAAAVSFDSPLDHAVNVNLMGPTRVAKTIQLASERHPDSGKVPHMIAVSTAYVAGYRRGDSHEAILSDASFPTEAKWQDEVAASKRARSDADAESRTPARLAQFDSKAKAELGAAGSPLLARRAEKLRQDWVSNYLVEVGKARAHSLGWPDAYAYTKALGELALLDSKGDIPLSIVRPSIIESAVSEPRPGWIRGFRMAEPIIVSYARGLLKEFPGIPEGIIDVIPVDLVVAAIIAVAAAGPQDQTQVYQVASGSANPLRYGRLVDMVQAWFTANPVYDSKGQPIVVPEWSFPGRGRVQRQLNKATKSLDLAEKAIGMIPVRGATAQLGAMLDERKQELERALTYVELYGSYSETEAIYRVDKLLGLFAELDEADQQAFNFDPRSFSWEAYVNEVHLPSVVKHARVKTSPGRRVTESRSERGRKAVLSPDRKLAAFDLENTLISSNVVESYAWLASSGLPSTERLRFAFSLLREAPSLLALDRKDRGDFLRHFYRHYEGADFADVSVKAAEMFNQLLMARCYPEGIRRVREHRALGHKTILITGALDFVVEPLRPLFDEVVCSKLRTDEGKLTGELEKHPPTGEARSQVIIDFADAYGFDLQDCVSYADSSSDLPMLEIVGFPVAVNAEPKLASMARRRGWHTETWSTSPGGSRPFVPLAPRVHADEPFALQAREFAGQARRLGQLVSAKWRHRRTSTVSRSAPIGSRPDNQASR